jgi:hypothetical protein
VLVAGVLRIFGRPLLWSPNNLTTSSITYLSCLRNNILSRRFLSSTMSKPSEEPEPSRFDYRIGRGEQGVLTYEPYKSQLLPLWRFRTVEIARKSSQDLWERFEKYETDDDFVGMDMSRKFIQMVGGISVFWVSNFRKISKINA